MSTPTIRPPAPDFALQLSMDFGKSWAQLDTDSVHNTICDWCYNRGRHMAVAYLRSIEHHNVVKIKAGDVPFWYRRAPECEPEQLAVAL